MARAPTPPAAKKPAPKKPTRAAARKPPRPIGLAHGRWLGDFHDLSPAEKHLVDCCARGEPWEPEQWDGKRPQAANAANTIRAELIRFLVLGGDERHPVHEAGVTAVGACVAGTLDLHQCRALVRLAFQLCHFSEVPILVAAHLPELVLRGSKLPGLLAGGLKVAGNVCLNLGFVTTGELHLIGAVIGGTLECKRATFTNTRQIALNADGINIAGDLSLDDGFTATGQVRLLGAEIGGNLDCSGGTFTNSGGNALQADGIMVRGGVFFGDGFKATGQVRLIGAEIGGLLNCGSGIFTNAGGVALYADGMKANMMRLMSAKIDGAIYLASARIGTIVDDNACWAAGGHLIDGMRYDRISGPTDAESRIRWLELQRADYLDRRDWRPQPWEQVIKTLREMGHPLAATQVAIAKQERMRRAGKVGGPFLQALHRLYGLLAGYGYRPLNTVWAMAAVWLVAAIYFHFGAHAGYIGPSTPLLNSPAISAQVEAQCGHRFEISKTPWTRCPAMPPEYTTFQPYLYSLDLILPLVDLQQEADWAPIVEDPPGNTLWFGAFLRWLMWAEILFGWAMSLMLVAVLGKLVNKD
jgi:hypothetical protein